MSFMVSFFITKSAASYTLGENLIKPVLKALLQGLQRYELNINDLDIDDFVQNLPISRTTISRRVKDMAENIKRQTMNGVRNSPTGFSIQADESTDIDNRSHLCVFAK
jgi:hypothetical protein